MLGVCKTVPPYTSDRHHFGAHCGSMQDMLLIHNTQYSGGYTHHMSVSVSDTKMHCGPGWDSMQWHNLAIPYLRNTIEISMRNLRQNHSTSETQSLVLCQRDCEILCSKKVIYVILFLDLSVGSITMSICSAHSPEEAAGLLSMLYSWKPKLASLTQI